MFQYETKKNLISEILTNLIFKKQTLLPPIISVDDINLLLSSCKNLTTEGKQMNGIILQNQFVVSKLLLDNLLALYEQNLKEKAEKGLLKMETKKSSESIDKPKPSKMEEEEEDVGSKRSSKKGKRTSTKKTEDTKPSKKSQQKEETNSIVTEVKIEELFSIFFFLTNSTTFRI